MESGDILFWIVAAALAGAAAYVLSRATMRPGAVEKSESPDLALYRAQLAEVDRDRERGTVTSEEAERLRVEIGRRLLAADRAGRSGAMPRASGPVAALGIVGLAFASAFGLYAWLGAPGYPDLPHSERIARAEALRATRPTQAEAQAKLPARPLASPDDPAMADLIAKLRKAVADRPDDLQGHELLARNEAALGNAAAAADAQARVVALKGAEATAGDYALLADSLILAAEGYVSPEAEVALGEALARDPGNGTARFYSGLLEAQTGRPDRAFALWRALLEDSPEKAPWMPVIRERIGMLAFAAGVDYVPPTAAPGPSDAEMAAAQDMAPEDRMAMIRGMVDQLGTRLANEGGSADEWARLITSLGVLGDADRARAVWTEAQDVFAADPSGLEAVAAAAREAGVAE